MQSSLIELEESLMSIASAGQTVAQPQQCVHNSGLIVNVYELILDIPGSGLVNQDFC